MPPHCTEDAPGLVDTTDHGKEHYEDAYPCRYPLPDCGVLKGSVTLPSCLMVAQGKHVQDDAQEDVNSQELNVASLSDSFDSVIMGTSTSSSLESGWR